jgi:tryptophanyl-tRNA synthetase
MIDSERVLALLDELAEMAGSPKISTVFKEFEDKVPEEYRGTVLSQIKQEIADTVAKGVKDTTEQMNKMTSDPDLLAKLKEMGPSKD